MVQSLSVQNCMSEDSRPNWRVGLYFPCAQSALFLHCLSMNTETSDNGATYDVIVIGGALSGAATATLLLRHNPGIRLLIVEKSAKLSRRVGEATVEVSAYFMGRVLGLTQYLNEYQLVKQGLRFWFKNDEVTNLSEASELGARYLSRIASYQLDRSTFDEEVLRRACLAGAELIRPASVANVRLEAGGSSRSKCATRAPRGPFGRAGSSMRRAWRRCWRARMAGGNRTPSIRPPRRGRAGRG